MKDLSLGEKIRNFRKRAGKSQFELETAIGAANGTVSRIESNEVNPTKETLLKVIDTLDLNILESVTLFGINPSNISNLLKLPKEILGSNNLDEILQKSVDSIVYELNLLSAFITLKEGNKLRAQVSTKKYFDGLVLKIIEKPLFNLTVDLKKDAVNLCVRAVLDKKYYFSTNLSEFIVPAVDSRISSLLAKITGSKSSIVFPIIHNGEAVGTFFVTKNYIDTFSSDIPILEAFADYIGDAIGKYNLKS